MVESLPTLILAQTNSAAVFTFLGYTAATFLLAWFSHKVLANKSFLSEYFLGSRGLGVIAFTLTFGATSASAGSFAGFPSLIYTHGWVLGLWIASYMLVPICGMGLMGKRINQVARRAGCITLPDVLRERFDSRALAIISTSVIVLMLSCYLIPQFKLASIILQRLLAGTVALEWGTSLAASLTSVLPFMSGVDPEYLICLLVFAVLVVLYTTFGGFRAVVWTDVMQGFVMIFGVVVLLWLALAATGGLKKATTDMAKMVPPELGTAHFRLDAAVDEDIRVPSEVWFTVSTPDGINLYRTNETATIPQGDTESNVVKVVRIVTPTEIETIMARWETGQPPALVGSVKPVIESTKAYVYGNNTPGVYVSAPGPHPSAMDGFLPLGMAFSFFFFWALSGTGQPGNLVRLMAFDSSKTLKKSVAALTIYFGMIYFPLVVIFCCARVIVPGLDQTPDRIMPVLSFQLSEWAGMPWLGGLLVAAPFAAAMSTVDSFMLMISSSVVRDIYQRNINPDAPEKTVKWMSYACMVIVGTVVTIFAINPPKFMQYLIVFTGGGLAVTFLIPMAFALYWPRINTPGMIGAMLGGLGVYLSFYIYGFISTGQSKPYRLLNFDPLVWGFAGSLIIGVVVALCTAPPPQRLVRKFFHAP